MFSKDFENSDIFRNLWRYVITLGVFNSFAPLVYTGVLAGSEFLTYDAKKYYIAKQLELTDARSPNVDSANAILYDRANAVMLSHQNSVFAWDTTAAAFKYQGNDIKLYNQHFSKITSNLYYHIHFIGYRLNEP